MYDNTIEKEKLYKEKYNPDDIFKNKEDITQKKGIEGNVSLVEYKESLLTKFINKLKKIIFKR